MEIKGRVVLMKKNSLDVKDLGASIGDRLDELLGNKVSLQLITSPKPTPTENKEKRKPSEAAYLEKWITTVTSVAPDEDSIFNVNFHWEESFDIPGAFIVRNFHHSEFYLKTLTLDDVPGAGSIHFICNSWIYSDEKYKLPRVFFTNKTYLPDETPAPIRPYREEQLAILRGDGTGELQEWDRVYDYAYYNDLGNPDKGEDFSRPVLGGSRDYPYPRRGRTGRPPTKSEPNTETRIPLIKGLSIYVPRDERFGHLKMSDFLAFGLKSIFQFIVPEVAHPSDSISNEFDRFEEALDIYKGGIKLPKGPLVQKLYESIPFELLKEFLPTDGEGLFKFPTPQIIQHDKSAWRTDEEFAREMLAGVNPVIISRLEEFPPRSRLDRRVYGDQTSTIAAHHIQNQLDGLAIDEAIKANRLFILNHHDTLMPYVRRINATTGTKLYATRTILFLQANGQLKPVAIELSLPHPDGDQHGAVSKVYTPSNHGVEGTVWQLAKAYATVNDAGVHQLLSHWLNTHAVIEPFIIAAYRQLSTMHPIHKLLQPHFRYTMNINAFAREILLNAGGLLEATVFPGKYAMELSAVVYKDWCFTDQALPADLLKRGMAVEDPSAPYSLRLLIEDYPYAVDGLEIWFAIKAWVEDYCSFYYKSDDTVKNDTELQSWWKELREKGHGDKKDEPWWPKMQTRKEMVDSCTTIIWIASALHAAVNFGQYSYAGYMPNRPTVSRRLMPEPGSEEYEAMKTDPEKVFFRTITARMQTLLGIALIELLSRHSTDEVYLGQRETPEWTADAKPKEDFEKFGKRLGEIEEKIERMNSEGKYGNRIGPVKLPYTLLLPTSEPGLTGRGIPNSTSM
ncbi:probable linoleate 9S-lipoxygenase 5 [Andrographis paniculata]|uniref:probable linoleate 9S-lipoxygenase 5 n=1 Tax=Andrographis paniculata TaxID=175694 RepID=UPI0021E82A15|nr:probable linoleate 9S-lipoxygenase 5 [Andrographis paniculata]